MNLSFGGGGMLPLLDEDGELDYTLNGSRRIHYVEAEVKHTEAGDGWVVGVAESIGERRTMEDSFFVGARDAAAAARTPGFGVFDGHGGTGCSAFAATSFPDALYAKVRAKTAAPYLPTADELENVCLSVDDAFLQIAGGLDSAVEDVSGCTATFALLEMDAPAEPAGAVRVRVGNVGDSRVIAVRDGKAVPMTEDHKPTLEGERERIREAGGWVTCGRVDGKLAVSRALGDTYFKQSSGPRDHKVICVPDVTDIVLSSGDAIMLSCDGVFESGLEEDGIAEIIQETLTENGDVRSAEVAGLAAAQLCNEALERGSTDNVTAMVVLLNDRRSSAGKGRPPVAPTRERAPPATPAVTAASEHLHLLVLERRADEADFGFTLEHLPSLASVNSAGKLRSLDASRGSSLDGELVESEGEDDAADGAAAGGGSAGMPSWCRISSVAPHGAACRAWLRAGMSIVSVEGRAVTTRDAFYRTVARLNKAETRRVTMMVEAEPPIWARVRRERICQAAGVVKVSPRQQVKPLRLGEMAELRRPPSFRQARSASEGRRGARRGSSGQRSGRSLSPTPSARARHNSVMLRAVGAGLGGGAAAVANAAVMMATENAAAERAVGAAAVGQAQRGNSRGPAQKRLATGAAAAQRRAAAKARSASSVPHQPPCRGAGVRSRSANVSPMSAVHQSPSAFSEVPKKQLYLRSVAMEHKKGTPAAAAAASKASSAKHQSRGGVSRAQPAPRDVDWEQSLRGPAAVTPQRARSPSAKGKRRSVRA